MQRSRIPFNVFIMDLTPEKLKNLSPVTSLSRFEGITHQFNPEGLFSVQIFGRPGDEVRSRRYAYIDIRVEVFHPVIYNVLISMKRLYGGIMSGKEYAIWNSEKKDFERSNPVDGDTGYHFFMRYWRQIEFVETDSARRETALKVINKYRRYCTYSKILVLPAGLRDMEIGPDGRPREDEINALYRDLLSVSNTISDVAVRANPELIDRARFKLQTTFNNIYEHFERLIYGKKKLIQGKFSSRRIMNGSRNVITALPLKIDRLGDPKASGFNDTVVGLFQLIKNLLPITLYQLRNGWLSQVFPGLGQAANLVDKQTLKRVQVQLPPEYYNRYRTNEGLEKVINAFRDDSIRDKAVEIKDHYIGLIYKGPGGTFRIFGDIDELPEKFDHKDVYPLTFCELIYLSGYRVWNRYPSTTTRYPVTGAGSIYPTMPYVKTTVQAERRMELNQHWEPMGEDYVAVEFPIPGPYMNAMSPHPTKLERLGGDHDGDMMTLTTCYSIEAIKQAKDFFKSRRAYIGTDGRFLSSTSVFITELVMHNLTGDAVKAAKPPKPVPQSA